MKFEGQGLKLCTSNKEFHLQDLFDKFKMKF